MYLTPCRLVAIGHWPSPFDIAILGAEGRKAICTPSAAVLSPIPHEARVNCDSPALADPCVNPRGSTTRRLSPDWK